MWQKEPKELNLKKGDILILSKEYSIQDKNNFWTGTKNGIEGIFPATNIQEIRGVATFRYDFEGKKKGFEINAKKGDTIVIFEKFKSGWWLGDINGRVGYFPKKFVVEEQNTNFVEYENISHNFKSKFPPPRPEKPDLTKNRIGSVNQRKSYAIF